MATQVIFNSAERAESVPAVFLRIVSDPAGMFLRRWNWKAALMSSLLRAHIFLAANATAGARKAFAAAGAELIFRFIASGFYGSLTQAFRRAEPAWAAVTAVMVLLPLLSHSMEFAVHLLRGTPHLKASIIASVCFTVVSTAFNWFAMRRGVLLVGHGERSLRDDLAQVPSLLAHFFLAIGRAAAGLFRNICSRICLKLQRAATLL